jgi:hypothetical protein
MVDGVAERALLDRRRAGLSSGLTAAEQGRLAELEAVVERGIKVFYEVGVALLEIHSDRLYRATHSRFEDYLDERWGMSRSRGYRLMDAARVAVSPIGDIPANEAQARELVPLLGDEAALFEVARELREGYGGRVTAERIRDVVKKHFGAYDDEVAAITAASVDPSTQREPLPEFVPPEPRFKLVIGIDSEEKLDELLELIGNPTIHKGTRGTLSTWWPDRPEGRSLAPLRRRSKSPGAFGGASYIDPDVAERR